MSAREMVEVKVEWNGVGGREELGEKAGGKGETGSDGMHCILSFLSTGC